MELKEILAFHQLVIHKSEQDKQTVASKLNFDYEEYKRRIIGKEKEAEFIVMLQSLEVLKHFYAYDEALSYITGEITSDFEVELIDGNKMLIEVKHTDKEQYNISSGNLSKRIAFAKVKGLQLMFAVSIKGYWGLFTSEDLYQKSGRLSIEDFNGNGNISWLDRKFETCTYMFVQPLKIVSTYEKEAQESLEIEFPPYGKLVKYEFYQNGNMLFSVDKNNKERLPYTFILESVQDKLSMKSQKIQESGTKTTILEEFNECLIVKEFDFMLAVINHMVDDNKLKYTADRFVDEKYIEILGKSNLRSKLSDLVALGMEIIVFRDENGYPFREFEKNNLNK